MTSRLVGISEQYLDESQNGFRPRRSCTDNIQALSSLWEKSQKYNFPVVLTFIDFRAAFDSIYWSSVQDGLLDAGFAPQYTEALKKANESGMAEVEVLGEKIEIKMERGVRQGDSSSPTLFAVALNKLLRESDPLPEDDDDGNYGIKVHGHNKMPTMKVSRTFSVNCSTIGPQSNCFAFTAVDSSQKVISITFRGTEGSIQLIDEIVDFFDGKKSLLGVGNIYRYFYDAFMFLWNSGLQQEIRRLKYQYPEYTVWSTGHSLGGSLASITAAYLVQSGLFKPENIKLVTLGQPRTGDYQYASWHDATFPYSFRVVHHRDPVVHIPPMEGADELFHHRTEVWYNNNMTLGSTYKLCAEADGLYCSSRQLDVEPNDHMTYFDVDNMQDYGLAGCI